MSIKAFLSVLQAAKAAPAPAIRGRLAGAFKKGLDASKSGEPIRPLAVKDTVISPEAVARYTKALDDYELNLKGMREDGYSTELLARHAPPVAPIPKYSLGDLGENMLARFVNASTSPTVSANATGSAIGIALGQNPIAAIGSNVAGNTVGRLAGNYARSHLGEKSLRAGAVEVLTNLGVSLKSSEAIDHFLSRQNGSTEQKAEEDDPRRLEYLRGLQQGVLSGRSQGYAAGLGWGSQSASGSGRQLVELAQSVGAYSAPVSADSLANSARPYSDPRVAGMVQSEIPPLDAATADKLRKRAIENAQSNQFLAGQLSSYMEGM